MNPSNLPADIPSMRSILVLGAGELGMAVLRPLAGRAAAAGVSIAVLLRPETIGTADAAKRADIEELLGLGCELVPGDIASASVTACHVFPVAERRAAAGVSDTKTRWFVSIPRKPTARPS